MCSPLGTQERERLHATFAALCRIPSPTGAERAVADWITAELSALGLDVHEDDAGAQVGASAGNLLARIPGTGAETILLCSHMDTVPLTAAVEPVQRDGGWENAGEGILGADNKAAVAAMVEAAGLLIRADGASTAADGPARGRPTVELLFTVSEETGLKGASSFDVASLQSSFGYVFDHASPVGEIIIASPTHVMLEAEIRGRAAHAGLQPEDGASAIVAAAHAIVNMPQGRLDADTTANVGVVSGGTASNVVPDRCTVIAEVRAVEQAQLDRHVTAAIDALQDAADTAACDLDLNVQEMFSGYRLGPRDPTVVLAQRALRAIGYEPTLRSSGGGSDANALRRNGFACTNLANGTERAHQRTERVSSTALEANLELMLALVAAAKGDA